MSLVGELVIKALEAIAVRMHVQGCKECRKKYNEILEHAKEEVEIVENNSRDKR